MKKKMVHNQSSANAFATDQKKFSEKDIEKIFGGNSIVRLGGNNSQYEVFPPGPAPAVSDNLS